MYMQTKSLKVILEKAIAKTTDNIIQRVDVEIKKPRKLTVSELEAYLGYPIEIVS